jgi:hypothetical protein
VPIRQCLSGQGGWQENQIGRESVNLITIAFTAVGLLVVCGKGTAGHCQKPDRPWQLAAIRNSRY